jgi:hypothetical protein
MDVAPTKAKVTSKKFGAFPRVHLALSSGCETGSDDEGAHAKARHPASTLQITAEATVSRKPIVGRRRNPAARAPITAPAVLTQ